MKFFLNRLLKFVFIKQRPIQSKQFQSFLSMIHTLWLPVALFVSLLSTLGVMNAWLSFFIIVFHLIIIIRNLNPFMAQTKQGISKASMVLLRLSIVVFILNVLFFTWGFAFAVFGISILANLLYIGIPNAQKHSQRKEEFKQQFGDFKGGIDERVIIKKHIENLFEDNIELQDIDTSRLKKQFRYMAKIYHPDKNNGEHNDKFHSIKQSYDFLKEKIDTQQ